MAKDDTTRLTFVGRLDDPPELRFHNGKAVCNFTVAADPPRGETIRMACSVWEEQALTLAESVRVGDRLVVVGYLRASTFTTSRGKVTKWELWAEDVARSFRSDSTPANP